MSLAIEAIHATEVLDSRGNPTVSAEVRLADGATAEASVPSGASTGSHEAVELRDGDPRRYEGRGVLRAVGNVNQILAPELCGMDASGQAAIDARMIELDGTPNKSRLGANAILAVSCAVARAAAGARRMPLWRYLADGRRAVLPVPLINPMVNILSGGLHAGSHIEFQDFLIVPRGFTTYAEALEAIVTVHRAARRVIEGRGLLLTGVADEGGWGPRFQSNEEALEILSEAIQVSGYGSFNSSHGAATSSHSTATSSDSAATSSHSAAGPQMAIAIDAASTHFWRDGAYALASEGRVLSSDGMIALLERWVARYPVVSIEDGLAEDDWEGWRTLTGSLGNSVQLIGDDLFVTNLDRLNRGIASGVANSVLVKMNQAGTLTETFAVIDRAREAGYGAVISARSGETEDAFLADLAVASGAGQIKVGSVRTSERLAKYNRLLKLEAEV